MIASLRAHRWIQRCLSVIPTLTLPAVQKQTNGSVRYSAKVAGREKMNERFSRAHLASEIPHHSATTLQRGRPEAVAPFRPVLIFRLEVDLPLARLDYLDFGPQALARPSAQGPSGAAQTWRHLERRSA